MTKKKILIVAHPDDEVLFFSSILKNVDKIIVCFGRSSDQVITKGRELLQEHYPLPVDIQVGIVPQKLCVDIKRLYMKYDCWTFNDHYEWPKSEIFAKIRIGGSPHLENARTLTANPPIMFFSQSFRQNLVKKIVSKILPKKIKAVIKSIINKGKS